MQLYLEIAFLFLGVLFTLINLSKLRGIETIPATNMVLWAIGVTGFIVLHWML